MRYKPHIHIFLLIIAQMERTLRRGQGNEERLWSRHPYESYTGHWRIGIHEQCLQSIFGLHDGRSRFHQNLNRKRSC